MGVLINVFVAELNTTACLVTSVFSLKGTVYATARRWAQKVGRHVHGADNQEILAFFLSPTNTLRQHRPAPCAVCLAAMVKREDE